jgi:acetyl-CoA synthetase
MGRPLPGYRIRVVDTEDGDAEEGLIAIALDPGPAG